MREFDSWRCALESGELISTGCSCSLETMLRSLESNAPRFNLLKYLHDVSMEEDIGTNNSRPSWVDEQRQWALEHLAPPSQGDVPILAGFVGGPDGLRILQHRRVYPVAHSIHPLILTQAVTTAQARRFR